MEVGTRKQGGGEEGFMKWKQSFSFEKR